MRWVKWVFLILFILIGLGLVATEWKTNILASYPNYRFNMIKVDLDKGITFVSYDPVEQVILNIPLPPTLNIKSRSNGEYAITSLYKLGAYEGNGGGFARQKIQGFMRIPIAGYEISNGETNLSLFDKLLLSYRQIRYKHKQVSEEELIRSGVIVNHVYHPERLREFVGSRLFDWGIGAASQTVAVVNASGVDGLGSDMADFLTNIGMDVVMVRSSTKDQISDKSSWQAKDKKVASELNYIFENLFGMEAPTIGNVGEEYRANVVVIVGKDTRELF